jgi:hypothetical protein
VGIERGSPTALLLESVEFAFLRAAVMAAFAGLLLWRCVGKRTQAPEER